MLKVIALSKVEYPDYWTRLGYEIGGLYIYKFVKFMLDTCKNEGIDHIAFTARDGYNLIKAFDVINTANISTSYVYAPRGFSIVYTSMNEFESYDVMALRLLAKFYYDVLHIDTSDMSKEEIVKIIRENLETLKLENDKRIEVYANYLRSKIGGSKNFIFMDITTGRFTC